jgi:nucleotide-binding universal stress UspA family protein
MIGEIREILYATDLSPNSAYVFRYALQSAKKHDARLHVLHVIERPLREFLPLMFPNLDQKQLKKVSEEKRDAEIQRIRARIQAFSKKEVSLAAETANRVASIEVVEGEPAVEILKKAEDLNCDVVIMGTHGKGAVSHAFLGSVAEKVLQRITRPVFVIPLPKGKTEVTFDEE